MRKYDILIHSPGYGERRCDSLAQLTIVVSKNQQTTVVSRIMEEEGPSLFNPLYLVQADMGMGEPHSLLAIYASAEMQTCDHDWYGGIFKLRILSSCRLFVKG